MVGEWTNPVRHIKTLYIHNVKIPAALSKHEKKITLVKEGKGVCVRQVDVRTASSSYCLPNRKRLVAFPALH